MLASQLTNRWKKAPDNVLQIHAHAYIHQSESNN